MEVKDRTFPPAHALKLMRQGAPAVLARLWASRGIQDVSGAEPALDTLLPFSALKGAEDCARLLADAIAQQRNLLIVADYDADGATACSVGLRALRAFGANVDFLVPKRLEHGYGLTPEIVDLAAARSPRPDYIVTVDNGIASLAGIAHANALGIPVIVTDHHLAADRLPDALMIVNPNQPGCSFPSKALAGCGVMWYCMWALQEELLERGVLPAEGFSVDQLLPIVAIGTIADVVALDQNNRTLVAAGLGMIRKGKSFPGIVALARESKATIEELSTTDIGFGIGPRINAAGRLQTMDAGVECLTTDDPERAQALAAGLHDINDLRKDIEAGTVMQAVEQLLADESARQRVTTVLFSPEWHPGVIGIVAGRFKEKLWRPTFVLAESGNGELKGSGRSIPGLHLRDALDLVDKRAPGLLVKFGGHAMAAGVTLRAGGFEQFAQVFEEVVAQCIPPEALRHVLMSDGPLAVPEMSIAVADLLKEHVWGQEFPAPLFCDVFKAKFGKLMGNGNHLRLALEKDGRSFNAIRFRHEGPIPDGRVRVAYRLETNTYRDETTVQLVVEHIQPA